MNKIAIGYKELFISKYKKFITAQYFISKAYDERSCEDGKGPMPGKSLIIIRGHEILRRQTCFHGDTPYHEGHIVLEAIRDARYQKISLMGASIYSTSRIDCLECLEMAKKAGIDRIYYGDDPLKTDPALISVYYTHTPFYREGYIEYDSASVEQEETVEKKDANYLYREHEVATVTKIGEKYFVICDAAAGDGWKFKYEIAAQLVEHLGMKRHIKEWLDDAFTCHQAVIRYTMSDKNHIKDAICINFRFMKKGDLK